MSYKKWLVMSGWWLVACFASAEEFNLSAKQQAIFQEAQEFAQSIHAKKCPLQITTQNQPLTTNHQTLIFISFSMGEQAILQYATEAKKIGGALVLRGLVNNSLRSTTFKLKNVIEKTGATIYLDPTLFRRFSISSVPAVVIENEKQWDVLYGLTTLEYALEHLRGRL